MLTPLDETIKTITAYGINHHTADAAVREKIAFSPAETASALTDCRRQTGVDEVALLSTCNRSELYTVGGHSARVAAWLAAYTPYKKDGLIVDNKECDRRLVVSP